MHQVFASLQQCGQRFLNTLRVNPVLQYETNLQVRLRCQKAAQHIHADVLIPKLCALASHHLSDHAKLL